MRPCIYVATLALALSSAHAQQIAPHPRRALSNKLQRRQILTNIAESALDDVDLLDNVLGLHRATSSPTQSSSFNILPVSPSPSDTVTRRSTSTSSSITSAQTAASDSPTSSHLSFTKSSRPSTTTFSSFSSESTATNTRGHGTIVSTGDGESTSEGLGQHRTGITSVLPATSVVSDSRGPTSAPTPLPQKPTSGSTSNSESSNIKSSLSRTLASLTTSAESSTETNSDNVQTTSHNHSPTSKASSEAVATTSDLSTTNSQTSIHGPSSSPTTSSESVPTTSDATSQAPSFTPKITSDSSATTSQTVTGGLPSATSSEPVPTSDTTIQAPHHTDNPIFDHHHHHHPPSSVSGTTSSDSLTSSQIFTDTRGPHHSSKANSATVSTTSSSSSTIVQAPTKTASVPTSPDTSSSSQISTDTRGSPHSSKTSSDTVSTTSSITSQDSPVLGPIISIISQVTSVLLPPPHTHHTKTTPTSSDALTSSQISTDTHGSSHSSKSSSDTVPITTSSLSITSQAPASTQNPILSIFSEVTSRLIPGHPTETASTSPDTSSSSQISTDTHGSPHSSKTSSDTVSTTSSITSQASPVMGPISSIISQIESILSPHSSFTKTASVSVSTTSESLTSTSQTATGSQDTLSSTRSRTRSDSHSSSTTEVPSSIPTSVSQGPTVVPSSYHSSVTPSSLPVSGNSSSVSASIHTVSPSVSSSQSPFPSSSGHNSSIVITFPSLVPSSSGVNPGTGSGFTTSHLRTTTAVSVTSDLSFVLSVSSLVVAPSATTTSSPTITNPDMPTTTLEPISESGPQITSLPVQPLPTGLPVRIYPPTLLDSSQVPSQYVAISILFNEALNWPFVVKNQVSSSQIFALLPVIIQTALNITAAQVETFALQVFVPATYTGPKDEDQLGTTYIGYISGDLVGPLEAMIKNKKSKFYTGVSNPVAQDLASHVDSGFSLNAIPSPEGAGSVGAPNPSSGATSESGKSRQDAIIGVVSALGGIALLVLAFLLYRSWKRRRELAHRRISDPPNDESVGVRPEGRDFDQDSVGGQRRRSFYYAEDSLRGFQQQSTAADSNPSVSPQQSMVQRRNLTTNMISTPVLRESSLQW